MSQEPTNAHQVRLEEAVQDALNHALAYGDDRTAFELATILRGMKRPYAIAA
jgi:hypothetical protein